MAALVSDVAPVGDGLLVRFSVVSFAPAGTGLAVLGSCPALGDWQPPLARRLRPRLGADRLESEPDFFWSNVKVPKGARVEYKFVELDDQGVARWEDLGPGQNRVLRLADGDLNDGVFFLPVARFAEGQVDESDHTGRFYQGVKDRSEISVRKVLSQIFVGSCPRTESHIDGLRSLGVNVVVNFQTEEDCRRNCVADIGMDEDPLSVSRLYEARGMEYIWVPTFDMSTDGRAQMLPHASFLFLGLLRRGHVVYSHCNAGVGRSVAAVCGYLMFALGLSERQMQHVVAGARPVAFFDLEALARARPRYEALFGVSAAPGGSGSEADLAGDADRKAEALALLARGDS